MIKWSCILRKCLVTAFTQVKVSRKQTSCSVCWLNKQCTDCDPFWGENGAVVSLRGCWSLARSCWLVCNRRQWRFITSTAQWTFITPWCYSNSVPSEDHPHSLSPSVVVTPVLLREPEPSPCHSIRSVPPRHYWGREGSSSDPTHPSFLHLTIFSACVSEDTALSRTGQRLPRIFIPIALREEALLWHSTLRATKVSKWVDWEWCLVVFWVLPVSEDDIPLPDVERWNYKDVRPYRCRNGEELLL